MAKRPVSPHVFEITGVQPHYKFPLGAISSITNRATGCMLSVGACMALFCCTVQHNRFGWLQHCSPYAFVGRGSLTPCLQAACASVLPRISVIVAWTSWRAGTWAAAYIALTGDLGAAINAFKEAAPLLVFPAKAVVAFPLVRHGPCMPVLPLGLQVAC